MTKRETLLRHPWALRREKLGIAQHRLGSLSGTSEQAVMRAEQGIFSKPPAEILIHLASESNLSVGLLTEEYFEYQKNTRALFASRYQDYESTRPADADLPVTYWNPLQMYRESQDISRIGICKGWCVHPASFFEYEKGNQRNIPSDIRRAFDEMKLVNKGWDWRLVEDDMHNWRLHKND